MSHQCHATGCSVAVPPQMFMCRRHWFSLPKAIRDAIWRTYRPGQCDDWQITSAYADAARQAVRFVATKEGRNADTSIYDMLSPEGGIYGTCDQGNCDRPANQLLDGLPACDECAAGKSDPEHP